MKNSITKKESEKWFAEHKQKIAVSENEKYRLKYHLMPQIGFLNDPNGLMQWKGVHHIYHQYCPYNEKGNIKGWGHYTTRDYIHYVREKIVLYPDCAWDQDGVYSGSAFPVEGKIHFFYTGNVKKTDRKDYDYITTGRIANVIHVESDDGYVFTEKERVLTNEDYPKDISNHVRDPKILEKKGVYYMVLGARTQEDCGCILVYESKDLIHWEYSARISSRETFGYMWECPDLFVLEGQLLLITCPQGVKGTTEEFENEHQACYMVLDAQPEQKSWEIENIHILDRGNDFYAPQTYLDENGRRICIAWMGMTEKQCEYPTAGWKHCLTLARELKWENGSLYQKPLEEYKLLRTEEQTFTSLEDFQKSVPEEEVYEWKITFCSVSWFHMKLREGISLFYEKGKLTLHYKRNAWGRESRSVKLKKMKALQIFSDVSSLEIFINDGEEVMTTRVFCDKCEKIQLTGDFEILDNTYYRLKGFTYEEA